MQNYIQLVHRIIILSKYGTVLTHRTGAIAARTFMKIVYVNKNETL